MATLKCCGCKDRFPSETMTKHPAGNFHSMTCAIEYAQAKSKRAGELMRAKASASIKKTQKAARTKHRADKERIKPLSKLLAETQAAINRYVRLRDRDLGCVSCDKPADWQGQWHASHFHSRGKSSRLRFNLLNIHKSCSVCNAHLSGNLLQYEPELLRRISRERYDWLESVASEPARYEPEQLRRMKRIFMKKCRLIDSRRY